MKVSIIMGIYNCQETLSEAVDSIINQTFTDWELIMCDDGSSDNTYKIAEEYARKYKNIHVLKNDKNLGLNKTLNRCLKNCNGKYIARMDGDDISLPTRLEKEYKFLENNASFALVSTQNIYFDENGIFAIGNHKQYPKNKDLIKDNPFNHGTIMIRKKVIQQLGGYSEEQETLRVEDYDLWIRMYSKGYKGYVLNEPLYKFRDDRNAYHRRKFKYRINEAKAKYRALKLLDLPLYLSIYIIKPFAVAILPSFLYRILHKLKINNS